MNGHLESSELIQEAKKGSQPHPFVTFNGFNLKYFVINVAKVVADLNGNTEDKALQVIVSDNETSHVLCLNWNLQSNRLVVSRGTSPGQKTLTFQRTVFCLVLAIIDLIDQYTVRASLLLKHIWRLGGQKLDDELWEDIAQQLYEWSKFLPSLISTVLSKSYFKREIL